MTSSPLRAARPRRAAPRRFVRAARAVLGGAAGVVWLALPAMTTGGEAAVASPRVPSAAPAAAPQDGTSTADLVLPLVAAGTAGALAGYAYVRRTRRARTRTTPGGGRPSSTGQPSPDPEEWARGALVLADDRVRAAREELALLTARFGTETVAPQARAVRDAGAGLAAAFRLWQQDGNGVPRDAAARREALAAVTGRCEEAGRLLDAQADAVARLRGPGGATDGALEFTRAWCAEPAARIAAAEAARDLITGRYGSAAAAPVLGHLELSAERMELAASRLDEARREADAGGDAAAAALVVTAGVALAQAGGLADGVHRYAAELAAAARLVPTALTGAESDLAQARRDAAGAPYGGRPLPAGEPFGGSAAAAGEVYGGRPVPAGGPADGPIAGRPAAAGSAGFGPEGAPVVGVRARVTHADHVLAAVRAELTSGRYDPLEALRRIVVATAPAGAGRAGVLPAAAELVARSAVLGADGFVTAHRGAVGAPARALLARAHLLLPADPVAADAEARRARERAEQDVRLHGNPRATAAGTPPGSPVAVLGGTLLGLDADGGPPAGFGGPPVLPRPAG
ncbi:hypothetical protein [Streptomyces tropicalis]|uniref:Secreted protein n=1 Tax=Streptomyces tropicalis TaxID=3034234 RepID=A0ABT6A142_9ACTN|nr:hypothetical protein [Streptomyces tropicalis]MDF3298086.1 hypothetical protein [Streptomyces tropicalis]